MHENLFFFLGLFIIVQILKNTKKIVNFLKIRWLTYIVTSVGQILATYNTRHIKLGLQPLIFVN